MAGTGKGTLILVQLDGGNDGLNTVIPYADSAYYTARPSLGLKQNEVLVLDNDVALHPSMNEIYTLFKKGELAIVQGVGYPNPNRSHGESMRIWERGNPDPSVNSGWLGRYLDIAKASDPTINAISIGQSLGYSLVGIRQKGLVINGPSEFFIKPLGQSQDTSGDDIRALNTIKCEEHCDLANTIAEIGIGAQNTSNIVQEALGGHQTLTTYPASFLSQDLQSAAQLVESKLNPIIIHVRTGAFDTHASQKDTHAILLKTVSQAIGAFQNDIEERGTANDVLILVFTEFGRRVRENGSLGTDHGTAEPVFLIGKRVKGGLYEKRPSLSDLDQGDLKFTVDYRQIYASVLEDWFQTDQSVILFSKYEKLSLLS